jgi:AraC-like DNA-binding protein
MVQCATCGAHSGLRISCRNWIASAKQLSDSRTSLMDLVVVHRSLVRRERSASPAAAEEMRSSVTSAFSEPSSYRMAMRIGGFIDFAVTHHGPFQARLTQVALDHLHLIVVKEYLPRIAFISVPQDQVLISLSLGGGSPLLWGGARAEAANLITLGPGARVHTRTEGPSRWGAIWFPINDFVRYSRALTGEALTLPGFVCLWRPPAMANRLLRRLLADVMRAAQRHPEVLTAVEAAHGLDQQLIHALIECLSGQPANGNVPERTRRHELMDRFEGLLTTEFLDDRSVAAISEVLGVSDRFLRQCCADQLGMNPLSYIKFRRLQLVHCALRRADPETLSVSEAAQRQGFRHLGRFAADYRDLFGEQPSVTLRQGLIRTMPELRPPRRTGRQLR